MAHLGKMAAEGHLVTAGPLATPGGARGLLVYRCASAEEAAAFASADPAVTAKRLSVEMYAFSSAGEWGWSNCRSPFLCGLAALQTRMPRSLTGPTWSLRREGKARGHGLFAGSPGKLGVADEAAPK
jgi:hypothetical protein